MIEMILKFKKKKTGTQKDDKPIHPLKLKSLKNSKPHRSVSEKRAAWFHKVAVMNWRRSVWNKSPDEHRSVELRGNLSCTNKLSCTALGPKPGEPNLNKRTAESNQNIGLNNETMRLKSLCTFQGFPKLFHKHSGSSPLSRWISELDFQTTAVLQFPNDICNLMKRLKY